jgi:hypothetical protein
MLLGSDPPLLAAVAVAIAGCAALPKDAPAWPHAACAAPDQTNVVATSEEDDSARIQKLPVCVASRQWSAGNLGDTVLYRVHRVGRRLEVGYFVYWSTERPWGKNVLSYTLVPALLIDATYSHFLWVLPGFKDVLHGAGDVEGVRVELADEGSELRVVGGTADDGLHRGVALSRDDLVDSRGRIVLFTDVWSHQFGAHGGGAFANAAGGALRCYEGATVQPMTDDIARAFRLGGESAPRRAKPAWRNRIAESETPSG